MKDSLPYRIAALCYLFDDAGRVLLLHRRKPPNLDMYSPVGGKLEQAQGEGPSDCAVREIQEETGLSLSPENLHLSGIVSECGYEGRGHWLIFLYEVTMPVRVDAGEFDEGRLEWHPAEAIDDLAIPDTDRQIIWPLFWQHRGGFFMVHIDCCPTTGELTWRLDQSS